MTDPSKLDWLRVKHGVELEQPVENPEKVIQVEKLLKSLTGTQREVVLLKAGAGLTHRVIGEYLWPDCSEGIATARSQRAYSAALKRLRGGEYRVDPVVKLLTERLSLNDVQLSNVLKFVLKQKG